MADDLDDALFSLAAGSRKPAPKKRRKASDSDDGDADSDAEEAPRRKKPATSSKRGKKAQEEEEEDDDESEFDDEEGLYENEEDRRKLMAMTELDREMILADRAEQRDKERQRRQLLQQRAVTDKANAKGRRKPADKGKGKGDDAKAPRGRAARNSQAARSARDWSDEESDGGRGGGKSSDEEEEFQPSGSSDASSDEEDGQAGRRDAEEEEAEEPREAVPPPPRSRAERGAVAAPAALGDEDEGRRHAAPKAKEPERERMRERERMHSDDYEAPEEASLDELLACQVTRSSLEEWFGQPFFERDALNGCVVRMAYGPGVRDSAGNTHPGYLVMEIVDIRESGRAYKFGPRAEPTNKHLALRDGMGITRVMAMANVSSKPFDEVEYERYKRHCGKTQRAPISREEAAEAAKRKQAATNYRWTSADLKVELERKRASRAAPVNPAAEKAMLKRRLELASGAGNVDEVAALEEQLAVLESHLINQTNNQRAFGMMDINKRNKQHNLTVAYKTTAAEEHGGGGEENNVFSRRETKLNIYWKTRNADMDDDKPAGISAAERAKAALPEKLTRAQQRMDPADLIRQLGLDVDVSLVRAAGPIAPNLQQRVLPAKWRSAALAAHGQDLSGKSVLTIADWKRRAGEY